MTESSIYINGKLVKRVTSSLANEITIKRPAETKFRFKLDYKLDNGAVIQITATYDGTKHSAFVRKVLVKPTKVTTAQTRR